MLFPETPAVLRLRHAVRAWLGSYPNAEVAVALSGGADSLALTAAAVAEVGAVRAFVVDHRLQDGSAGVALEAVQRATALGCVSAETLTVHVDGVGGVEASARRARYEALDNARGNVPVLLGHTLDDQAETVLLGLARGSGARSIWGMRAYDAPWGRPLLTVDRSTTRQACADLGLTPHDDPHNQNADFTRVRLRLEVLPLLEDVLGGGVAQALARTAEQLRDDGAVLDDLADSLVARATVHEALNIEILAGEAPALRRRAIRAWLLRSGAKAVTEKHLRAIDELVVAWHGQGGVAVGGGRPGTRLVAARQHGKLTLSFAKAGSGELENQ
ncbi:tRNA lysidine(34) synthetase TilS [Antrihabitans sp. YC2-6]|uniref:tRNA lysidine(34) synthetase TilS n=1 Tax=Antrihabitans sp. YC2-6 TaxID=2799498 RepID=UPI0018F4F749|nr:tRNA lysidine(34) synthetase TilS [Antrihabitans sp. YC2-6]MBJ8345990.1 tRNA lysidine(34) synthetase TilS [Antrihabitans sp. YC2-6]